MAKEGSATVREISPSALTPVSEIGPHKFTPGNISRTLIEDYSAEVQPQKQAA